MPKNNVVEEYLKPAFYIFIGIIQLLLVFIAMIIISLMIAFITNPNYIYVGNLNDNKKHLIDTYNNHNYDFITKDRPDISIAKVFDRVVLDLTNLGFFNYFLIFGFTGSINLFVVLIGIIGYWRRSVLSIYISAILCLALAILHGFKFIFHDNEITSLLLKELNGTHRYRKDLRSCEICYKSIKSFSSVNTDVMNVLALALDAYECCGIKSSNDVLYESEIPYTCCHRTLFTKDSVKKEPFCDIKNVYQPCIDVLSKFMLNSSIFIYLKVLVFILCAFNFVYAVPSMIFNYRYLKYSKLCKKSKRKTRNVYNKLSGNAKRKRDSAGTTTMNQVPSFLSNEQLKISNLDSIHFEVDEYDNKENVTRSSFKKSGPMIEVKKINNEPQPELISIKSKISNEVNAKNEPVSFDQITKATPNESKQTSIGKMSKPALDETKTASADKMSKPSLEESRQTLISKVSKRSFEESKPVSVDRITKPSLDENKPDLIDKINNRPINTINSPKEKKKSLLDQRKKPLSNIDKKNPKLITEPKPIENVTIPLMGDMNQLVDADKKPGSMLNEKILQNQLDKEKTTKKDDEMKKSASINDKNKIFKSDKHKNLEKKFSSQSLDRNKTNLLEKTKTASIDVDKKFQGKSDKSKLSTLDKNKLKDPFSKYPSGKKQKDDNQLGSESMHVILDTNPAEVQKEFKPIVATKNRKIEYIPLNDVKKNPRARPKSAPPSSSTIPKPTIKPVSNAKPILKKLSDRKLSLAKSADPLVPAVLSHDYQTIDLVQNTPARRISVVQRQSMSKAKSNSIRELNPRKQSVKADEFKPTLLERNK